MKKKNWIGKLIIIALVILAAMVYFFVPAVRVRVHNIVAMFASGDFNVISDFVSSYGAYAVLISFLLMILQSVAWYGHKAYQ